MQKDVQYWDDYYSLDRQDISQPSDFAKFVAGQIEPGKKLLDLGCGNGRDSLFFCGKGIRVTSIDSSAAAIASIERQGLPIFAVCNDFVSTKALDCVDYDYVYARWTIHAINQQQQDILLPRIRASLKKDGLFFAESRTVNDAKYGDGERLGTHEYFFDNHYRRFLEPDVFLKQLEAAGFKVKYFEESDRFSVVGDDAPTLLRVIASIEADQPNFKSGLIF